MAKSAEASADLTPLSRLVWVHSFSDEHANVVRAPFSRATGLWKC
jgi:hypothetical protein